MKWERNDKHNAMMVAAGLTTGMLFTMLVIFTRWIWLDYVISRLEWVLLLLMIVVTGLCITVAWGYEVGAFGKPKFWMRVPTYSHPRFAKSVKEKEVVETIVHQALCGVTREWTKTDQASDMLIQHTEVSVTATNPDDVERLYKFVKQQTKEDRDET